MRTSPTPRSGFTLVEMLIVVAILGLLAAVAIPQFIAPGDDGRSAAMVSSLSILRTAIDSYWSQHDEFPGQTDSAEFTAQLCNKTNAQGEVGDGEVFTYGPYLRKAVLPTNPLTGSNSVRIVAKMPGRAMGDEAWIYDKSTGEVRANLQGKTLDGTKYFDL